MTNMVLVNSSTSTPLAGLIVGRRAWSPPRFEHRRDTAITKGDIPNPVKRTKFDLYEERKQFPKPVYKPVELAPYNKAVIDKRPVLKHGFTRTEQGESIRSSLVDWEAPPPNTFMEKRYHEVKKLSEFLEQKRKQIELNQAAKLAPAAKGVTPAVKTVKEVKPAVAEVKPAAKEVKPAVKAAVKDVKQAVPEVKPAAREVKETKTAVTDSAASNNDKKESESNSTEPNSEGQYELSKVLSKALQEELQQIMIKAWQELPDSPPTEAECSVADYLRNKGGDRLQNVLGLGVTTRLLNIHNPLYCKLQFSGKPEPGCLESFIKKYNITAFKRIAVPHGDLFAARFDRIEDYDKLCVKDVVMCGSAEVQITPCYKYLSCPPSIKTIYSINDKNKPTAKQAAFNTSLQKAYSAEVKDMIGNNEQSTTNKQAKAEGKPNPDVTKVQTKPNNNKVASADTEKKQSDKSKNDAKTDDVEDMMVVDEMEDDVEMTDQDILALMSGGIVLDECSGSEDEK